MWCPISEDDAMYSEPITGYKSFTKLYGDSVIVRRKIAKRREQTVQKRDVAGNGECSACGGIHSGSYSCPFRCKNCGVNVSQGDCEKIDCPNRSKGNSITQSAPAAPESAPPQNVTGTDAKLDAVLDRQSERKHPDCVAEGCFNKIHHGVVCRGMCEKLEEF